MASMNCQDRLESPPSFGTWCKNQFGGINSKAYARIFELMLRLKANYFWPAMWDSRFNEDDPLSPQLADDMGIVMGTSHHEPMMRAHKEYVYRKDSIGAWDYATNKANLDRFFEEGLERNKAYDNLITIGMRGDGDVAMGNGDDEDNMKTLKDVVDGHPAVASAGVAKIYLAATLGDSITMQALFERDKQMTDKYNKVIAGGKWDGMMLDKHIGYRMWSMPSENTLPQVANPSGKTGTTASETAIMAHDYTRRTATEDARWVFLPGLGRGKGNRQTEAGSGNLAYQRHKPVPRAPYWHSRR